jgi:two-component system, LytTR family, response regulator LytT
MKLKCVAIDDEPLALDLVCKFVEQTAFLSLEGKFDNAIEALGFINQHPVDLLFLDIQMPDLSGMELARVLEGRSLGKKPKIIFTTAYNQFAIEGYKVDAVDYLLKPFSYEEFLVAAGKAYRINEQNIQQVVAPPSSQPDYIFLKVEYQLVKIAMNSISYIEAYKDYVKVHLIDKPNPVLSLTSLKSMEDMLPQDRFMRIHRSFIINLEHIVSVSRNVVRIGNTHITVSENYKDPFLQFINKWMS